MSDVTSQYVVTRGLTRRELRWFLSLRDEGDVFLDLPTAPRQRTIEALCDLEIAYKLDSNRLCISEIGKRAKVLSGRRLHFLKDVPSPSAEQKANQRRREHERGLVTEHSCIGVEIANMQDYIHEAISKGSRK